MNSGKRIINTYSLLLNKPGLPPTATQRQAGEGVQAGGAAQPCAMSTKASRAGRQRHERPRRPERSTGAQKGAEATARRWQSHPRPRQPPTRTRAGFRVFLHVRGITPTLGLPQFLKNSWLNIKATPLISSTLARCCISVNKIRCNGNGPILPRNFPTKSWEAGKKFSEVMRAGQRSRKFTSKHEIGGVLMRTWGSVGGGNHGKLRAALLWKQSVYLLCFFPIQQRCQVTQGQPTYMPGNPTGQQHSVRGSMCLSKSGLGPAVPPAL